MSSVASISADWPAGLYAACDRLVHPSVIDEGERERQKRFIGSMLAAPFFVGGAAALVFSGTLAMPVLLAVLCAVFGLAWLTVLAVAQAGFRRSIEMAALAATTAGLAIVIAAGGGGISPLMLLIAAPAFEAWFVGRSRNGAVAGGTAAAAGVIAVAFLVPFVGAGAPSPWHWLVPLVYAATVWLRAAAAGGSRMDSGDNEEPTLETLIPAVVIRFDRAGDVLDASGQAQAILGLRPELLFNTGFFDRIHVADRVAYLCAFGDVRAGAVSRTVETRLRLPAGSGGALAAEFRLFQIELLNARNAAGEIVGLVRDHGEASALRGALADALEEAESTEVAKSRFLAAVSHELRTPLNAIIGFSDILLHEMFGTFRDPRQREYVGLIQQSGNHLLAIVNSILDVSKIEAGAYPIEAEAFAFREAVEMCHSMMAFQARSKSILLVNEVGHETGDLCADRRAVQQMLINLVSNAIKFTPEGGEVRIGAGRVGSKLTFWVADTGIGIAENDLARLGQPFMQVQNDYTRQFEGTGLGLSLVKGLVALHQGAMSIESEPAHGTTVSISLPVAGPMKAAERAEVPLAISARPRGAYDGAFRKTA